MNGYQADWIGAIGAGIAAVVAFLVANAILRRSNGKGFYVVVGLLTVVFSLGLRMLLRYFGI
jgi:crotonobetainyl-CoA:carnitine CoA-transferase CaiB-like acyl-CoA transferase